MDLRADAQVFVPRSSVPKQVQGDLLIAQLADAMTPTTTEADASVNGGGNKNRKIPPGLVMPVGSDAACSTQPKPAVAPQGSKHRNTTLVLATQSPSEAARSTKKSKEVALVSTGAAFPASGLFCPVCIDGMACAFHMTDVARCSADVYHWLHRSPKEAVTHSEGKDSRHPSTNAHRQQRPTESLPPVPPPPPPPRFLSTQSEGKPTPSKQQDDGDQSTDVGGSGYAESDDSDVPSPNSQVYDYEQSKKHWVQEGWIWKMCEL